MASTAPADVPTGAVAPPGVVAPTATAAGDDGFSPVAVLEADLAAGLRVLLASRQRLGAGPPAPPAAADPGEPARRARQALVLVRLHGQPLGLVVLRLDDPDPAGAWTAAVAGSLATAVAEHARQDGLSQQLDLWNGVGWNGAGSPEPRCRRARRAALSASPPASVVVATHERPDRLRRCLDSLLSQSYPEFEIVVVDNAPRSDATFRLLREAFAGERRVRYVREDEQGLGAAHNGGLAVARGDILAFTDDDVLADRHWLAEMVSPFVEDPAVAAVTGLILPAELETPAQLMLEAHGRFTKGFAPRRFDLAANRPGDRLFPFAAGRLGSGANMAFEAAHLRRLGGFDPALGTGTAAKGGDDLDAIYRTIASGRTLAYQPGAIVWHHHRRELPALQRQAYGYGVGLGAYLAALAVREPRQVLAMLARLPSAGAYAISHTAPGAVSGGDVAARLDGVPPWPARLSRLQRRGLLGGPFAYARSRLNHARHARSRSAPSST